MPFNDLRAVERAIDSRTAAVMVEPIQGEGGVNVPDDGYLPGLRKLCDEAGVLLVLDEIQTGMGRTGRLWAYEHSGIEPDIMTLAKALANGVPIGATLATESVASRVHAGHPRLDLRRQPVRHRGGPDRVHDAARGAAARARGRHRAACCASSSRRCGRRHPKAATAVRGRGLLVGIDLVPPVGEVIGGLPRARPARADARATIRCGWRRR